jgi:hypothetical protein
MDPIGPMGHIGQFRATQQIEHEHDDEHESSSFGIQG